jgi:hypothetical protein
VTCDVQAAADPGAISPEMKKKIIVKASFVIVLAVAYWYIQIIPGNVGTGETRESPVIGRFKTSHLWSV